MTNIRFWFASLPFAAVVVGGCVARAEDGWNWKQSNETERRAYSCAALSYILTAAVGSDDERKMSRLAEQSGMILRSIGGAHTELRTKLPVTNGQIGKTRDGEARLWAVDWNGGKRDKVVAAAIDCLGWASSVSEKASKGQLSRPDQVSYEGPYTIDRSASERMAIIVSNAFAAWYRVGGQTPSDLKAWLERDLGKR